MSTVQRPPERPIDGYESVRDEWIAAVAALMDDAERWSRGRGWDVRRQVKPMYESALGSYEVPRLLLHNGIGRVLLDPIARYVSGGEGAVEVLSVPDYDGTPLVREEGRWAFHRGDGLPGDEAGPEAWSESSFARAVDRAARM